MLDILQFHIYIFIASAFPENAVKGVLKHLLLTLPRYYDAKSRRAVCEVVQALSTHQLEPTVKFMAAFLTELAENINKQNARYKVTCLYGILYKL